MTCEILFFGDQATCKETRIESPERSAQAEAK
jgi:hypothetical protein